MKRYNTYQEAKISNPDSKVWRWDHGFYTCPPCQNNAFECDPANYCMNIKDFLLSGYKFVVGDIFINSDSQVFEIGKRYPNGLVISLKDANRNWSGDDECYVLKSLKLEITTETPEKSEALDAIAQVDSEEWKPRWAKWNIGDKVEKIRGSKWTGKIVGYYSTELTPKGYAVESETEVGSVQIYPECALKELETTQQLEERELLDEQKEARKNALLELESALDVKSANINIDCTYAIAVTVKAMIELGYRKEPK